MVLGSSAGGLPAPQPAARALPAPAHHPLTVDIATFLRHAPAPAPAPSPALQLRKHGACAGGVRGGVCVPPCRLGHAMAHQGLHLLRICTQGGSRRERGRGGGRERGRSCRGTCRAGMRVFPTIWQAANSVRLVWGARIADQAPVAAAVPAGDVGGYGGPPFCPSLRFLVLCTSAHDDAAAGRAPPPPAGHPAPPLPAAGDNRGRAGEGAAAGAQGVADRSGGWVRTAGFGSSPASSPTVHVLACPLHALSAQMQRASRGVPHPASCLAPPRLPAAGPPCPQASW